VEADSRENRSLMGRQKTPLLHRLGIRYHASKKKWDKVMFITTFIMWIVVIVGTAYILKENCGC
jgi:hypothetical protein